MSASNTNNVWQEFGTSFRPGQTANQRKVLPPGTYKYAADMSGWWLERASNQFEFPYKIYGNHDHIINRIKKSWGTMAGNLGILLNGLKGTGKTVTAQLVANWVIEELKMPVLVVSSPIPMADVLAHIEQEVLIIFDEFEKTHAKTEHQQALLTAIDGMARNSFKRMFIFTTNESRVEDNFIDRPSRIRYMWEFDRLEENLIEELMNDLLDKEMLEYKSDIVAYLTSRSVCSIDTAKTVITEVNVFQEPPAAFEEALNLSELRTSGFNIDYLDEENLVIESFCQWFKPRQVNALRTWLSKSGARRFQVTMMPDGSTADFNDFNMKKSIRLLQPTEDDPNVWFANVAVSIHETWLRKVKGADNYDGSRDFWVDERPEDWETPEWARRMIKGEDLDGDVEKNIDNVSYEPYIFMEKNTVYGTDKLKVFKIRITPLRFKGGNSSWQGVAPVSYSVAYNNDLVD